MIKYQGEGREINMLYYKETKRRKKNTAILLPPQTIQYYTAWPRDKAPIKQLHSCKSPDVIKKLDSKK